MNPLSPTVTISQSCSTITGSLAVSRSNMGAQVLLGLVSRGTAAIADGGWTILQIAAGLIRRHHAQHTSTDEEYIPTSVALAGHQLALKWCLDYLTTDYPQRRAALRQQQQQKGGADDDDEDHDRPHPVVGVQMSNLPVLLCLIQSQLCSKQSVLHLRSDERRHLSVLCVQAFLKGLAAPKIAVGAFASNIRMFELPAGSGSVLESHIFDGVVIDIPLPPHAEIAALRADDAHAHARTGSNGTQRSPTDLKCYVGLTVALYDINLTFDAGEHFSKDIQVNQVDDATEEQRDDDGNNIGHDTSSTDTSFRAELYRTMDALVSAWTAAGVTLVAAQKVIHPYLHQRCLELGVLTLERLSIRHIDAVRQVAGGVVLSGVDPSLVRPAVVGRLARLEERLIGRRRYLFLTPAAATAGTSSSATVPPPSAPGISTLLLSCSSSSQLSELSSLLPRVFTQLSQMLRAPTVCAGAGATEMALAQEVRRRDRARVKGKRELFAKLRRDLTARADAAAAAAASSASNTATAAAVPLAQLDLQLYTAHLSRLAAQDRLLSRACLQLADALEEVACFTAWQQSTAAAAGRQSTDGRLFEEVKQALRDYHQRESAAAPVEPSVDLSSAAPAAPSLLRSRMSAHGDPSHPAPSPSPEPTFATLDHASTSPTWSADADWQLAFESRCGPPPLRPAVAPSPSSSSSRTSLSNRTPHALYGYHSSRPLKPTPVFRVDSQTRAIIVDDGTVLDLVSVKRSALQIAVEAASVLIRVDQIVHEHK